MKFLVVLIIVGLVAADEQLPIKNPDPSKKAAALKILTADVKEHFLCSTDQDCSTKPEKPVCDPLLKLCKPRDAPSFELTYGTCAKDQECRPAYLCKDGKCNFSGPKSCEKDEDCLQGVAGKTYNCKEIPKSMPGKRCWYKCNSDKDCYQCEGDKCRIPDEARSKIGCCEVCMIFSEHEQIHYEVLGLKSLTELN